MSALIYIYRGRWELVHAPPGADVLPCRSVYTLKDFIDGTLAGYKERLLAKGYTKPYGETESATRQFFQLNSTYLLCISKSRVEYISA